MKIKFSTSTLEKLYLGDEEVIINKKIPFSIVKSYIETVDFLSVIKHSLEIRQVRWYNLEKIWDHRSMRLNQKRRLEVKFEKWVIQVVDILQISNHYWNKIR